MQTNPYSDMSTEELILLSVGYIGRGVPIPNKIKTVLGPELVRDIENPETSNGH